MLKAVEELLCVDCQRIGANPEPDDDEMYDIDCCVTQLKIIM